MENAHALTDQIFRWIHVFAGITWIGHLYFFNWVNSNFAKTLDAEIRKKVVPELMPRALFFFRWGAMFTFLSGLFLLYWVYMHVPEGAAGTTRALSLSSSAGRWIMMGALFGTIMWFNVWFIIWPAQKQIIRGIRSGNPAPPALAARATTASKINTYLSAPLIFAMLAAPHGIPAPAAFMLGVLAAAFAVVWHLYKIGAKVSTEV